MIPASPPISQISVPRSGNRATPWQQLWRDAITDPHELLRLLGLESRSSELLANADTGFSVRVPRGFAARMRHADATDPLLLQVLPGADELSVTPGYSTDAVGDLDARAATGVLHKYQGRALLIATGSCAINCRYCFRRHFPYAQETAASGQWRAAIEYLASNDSISEVILSGGDPLSLSTPKLAELTGALADLAHVRRLRIHSRLPIVLPERVDAELCDWLHRLPLQKVLVLHANHANEIDDSVIKACRKLTAAGVTLLNQSVLLRHINDTVDVLAALSERLFDCNALPYYLHQLDRVQGVAHFEVSDQEAVRLIDGLRNRLPGYLVPRLVRETAGATSKLPIGHTR
ncbi:MAG TPA: EF-P beta-lysylation protein EpmB [Dokdonella sp.]|uniref:EF-P beta-lysylation protein EpmB n=1 Tax=Dokdonella sp. TaxID=2291710 RepID=UPI002D7EF427|nr:EF-P beta-lysylation protein EpmB [Dokdonella sp.]HET9032272.1 EF-P beta-lysylation protein EpmB [Dokdonella sp.]